MPNRDAMDTVAIVIADDHTVVRSGLRLLLETEPGFSVAAEAGTVEETVAAVREHRPDVLILDLHMGEETSLAAVPELTRAGARVVVLTMQNDPAFVREALRAGALGYVVKEAADTELVEAVGAAMAGRTWVSPQLGAKLVTGPERSEPLSPRELEVLGLIGSGYTNREVAEALGLSVRTVESHRGRIQVKLDLHSRRGLVQYALRHGLVQEAIGDA